MAYGIKRAEYRPDSLPKAADVRVARTIERLYRDIVLNRHLKAGDSGVSRSEP